MITCAICSRQLKVITNTHLARHNMTIADYKKIYSGPVVSQQTRDAMSNHDIDWSSIPLGKSPDSIIADLLSIDRRRVCYERNKRNIPAFSGYLMTQEGYHCRSVYEAMYDAYLHWQGIPHQHEVAVEGLQYIADFYVNGMYIEIAGMKEFAKYYKKYEKKRQAYKEFDICVLWLDKHDVTKLYIGCPIELNIDPKRKCKLCGKYNHNLVEGYCKGTCYMKMWREQGQQVICENCSKPFNQPPGSDQKFCSHKCYSESQELEWPSWEWLAEAIKRKSIRQVAFDIGVKPSSLYMHIRRRKQRNNGGIK